MVRLMGLCLVFLAFAGTGFGMANALLVKLRTAEELLHLIRKIGFDVRCYKRPLPEILSEFEGEHLHAFVEKLHGSDPFGAVSALETDEEVKRICLAFFEKVGKCSADECEKLESECVLRLTQCMEGMKEEAAKKMKVYRSLGLSGAAAAVILLL